MLTLPASVRVFLCLEPVDMRLSFDRLAAVASGVMEQDPFSGHLFVFRSKRRDRVKVLYWDRDGMAIWMKRLEKGTFPFPDSVSGPVARVTPSELAMLLDGVVPSSVKRTRRFSFPSS